MDKNEKLLSHIPADNA